MSDDRDHTIATATVTSEETPYGVRINTGGHALRGDEPAGHGGGDTGPAPFGLLLSGLGACTAITLRMYAEHQSWPLAGVDVELTYVVKDRNTRWIDRLITLHGIDEDQRAKLAEIAEKTPVTSAVRAGTGIPGPRSLSGFAAAKEIGRVAPQLGAERAPSLLQPSLQLGMPPDAVAHDLHQLGGLTLVRGIFGLVPGLGNVGQDRVFISVPLRNVSERFASAPASLDLSRRGQVKVDPDAKDCPSRRQGMLPQPERFPGRH